MSEVLYKTRDELYQITRKETVTRGQAIKAIWDYAKKYELNEGRNIHPDGDLIPVLGRKTVTAAEVMKKIGKFLIKI